MKFLTALLFLISTALSAQTLTIPLPTGCNPIISHSVVTCDGVQPPVQPPIQPPAPPVTPPPSPAADYVVSASTWSFAGNYRLNVLVSRATVKVAFTTPGPGLSASINLQVSSGSDTMHSLSVNGVTASTSHTPEIKIATVARAGYVTLQPNTTYVLTVGTPDPAYRGTWHLNFQHVN